MAQNSFDVIIDANIQKIVQKLQQVGQKAQEMGQKASESIKKMEDKFGAFGDKASKIGGDLMSISAPLGALGIGAGVVAAEFEGATAKIRNSLGLTEEQAEALSNTAKNIYKNGFGESLDHVSDALIRTRQNMKNLSDEDLEKVTQQAIVLGQTFDSDVNEITRAGANIMEGFGVSADVAMDLMASGAQNGLNFSNELFDNLSEYSTLFGSMGFSVQEYFQLLEQGSSAGVYNLDYLNDVMKEFQIRVKDGSKTTSDAMGQMSDSTQKVWESFMKGEGTVKDVHNTVIEELAGMEDQVKANEIGVGLYGTKWEDLESKAMYSLGGIEGGVKNVEGTMAGMVKVQEETFGTRFQSALRETKSALEPLGNVLLDLAEAILPPLAKAVEKVSEWFSKMSPTMQIVTVAVGGFIAALGPVIAFVGMIATGIAALMPVFTAIGGAIAAVAGVISLPIVAIVAAVAAAVALIIIYWDEIKAFITNTWNTISTLLTTGLSTLSSWWNTTWTAISTFFTTLWTGISTFFSTLWSSIVSVVMAIITPFIELIQNTFNSMRDNISNILSALSGIFKNIWDIIKNVVLGAVLLLINLVTGNFEGFKTNLSKIMDNIKTALSNIWTNIKTVVTNLIAGFINGAVTWFNTLKTNVTNIFNNVKTAISNAWNSIKSTASTLISNIVSTVRNKFTEIVTAVSSKMSEVKSKISSKWNEVKSFFSSINLASAGRNIIQGLINGITGMAGSLLAKAKSIADSVTRTIKNALKIKSPSRVMRELGQWTGEGLYLGLEDEESSVLKSAKKIAEAVTQPFGKGLSVGVNTDNIQDSLRLSEANYKTISKQQQIVHVNIYGNDLEQSGLIDKIETKIAGNTSIQLGGRL